MPSRLKTPCCHLNCRRAAHGRYCAEHCHLQYQRPADRRRGTPAQRGYDNDWRKARDYYICKHPLCEDCLDEGVTNSRNLEVDHIIPIEVRPDLRLDLSNLRTRCRQHHVRKTQEDAQRYA